MDILRVDPQSPDPLLLAEAAEAVLRGGVIAFPTDTVYGLSCSLMDPAAVSFLYRIKRRPPDLSSPSLPVYSKTETCRLSPAARSRPKAERRATESGCT